MQKKTSEERMTTLIQTLDNIVKYEYVDETDSSPISDNVKQYWEHLCGVYEDPEFRHSFLCCLVSCRNTIQNKEIPLKYISTGLYCFQKCKQSQKIYIG